MPGAGMAPYLALLPDFMVTEINRYRTLSDRQSRLLARLMLLKYLKQENQEHLIHHWTRDDDYKPFIAGWKEFNIAHSGDITAICFAETAVGLDIEKTLPIDVPMMADHFRPEETRYILASNKELERFYDIWVRKEAVLKAAGTGIVNGLKEICCLETEVYYNNSSWYLTRLQLGEGYTSYVCSAQSNLQPLIVSFDPRELLV